MEHNRLISVTLMGYLKFDSVGYVTVIQAFRHRRVVETCIGLWVDMYIREARVAYEPSEEE